MDPTSAVSQINQAIQIRQEVIAGLQPIDVSDLQNGQELISQLTQAEKDSITADQSYSAWMAGFSCGADLNVDVNYQEGNSASTRATGDKREFIALWNPLAANDGFRQYQEPDL